MYRLAPGVHVVQTVDFFAPLVDDPFAYGRIAAANALSDVYALGARPVIALNLVAFPAKVLPLSQLEAILAGGADACLEADVTIVGGHSIDDPEPKYGLAVTGLVDPARAVLASGAHPGDVLLLGKAIGTGIVANAIKRGEAPADAIDEAVASMSKLNRRASELMLRHGATACTDVTGFGLLGHLHNLLVSSGAAARLHAAEVPVLRGARALAASDHFPGGTKRNLEASSAYTEFVPAIDARTKLLLADAQTSGGLLVACPAASARALSADLTAAGYTGAAIGEVVAGPAGTIRVE